MMQSGLVTACISSLSVQWGEQHGHAQREVGWVDVFMCEVLRYRPTEGCVRAAARVSISGVTWKMKNWALSWYR